jgi:hypothetical protein
VIPGAAPALRSRPRRWRGRLIRVGEQSSRRHHELHRRHVPGRDSAVERLDRFSPSGVAR